MSRVFIGTAAIYYGLNILVNLTALGMGTLPTYTTGGLAFDTAMSCLVLVWALLILYGKEAGHE